MMTRKLIIILILTLVPIAPLLAEEKPNPYVAECVDYVPVYTQPEANRQYTSSEILVLLGEAQNQYHTYQQCLFDEVEGDPGEHWRGYGWIFCRHQSGFTGFYDSGRNVFE